MQSSTYSASQGSLHYPRSSDEPTSGKLSRFNRIWKSPFTVTVIGGAALYFSVVNPEFVARILPPAAVVFDAVNISVNPAKAQLRNIQARRVVENGEERLVVEGDISNISRNVNKLRDLKLSLLGENGQAIYMWVAKLPSSEIAGRSSMNFRTTLSAPPPGNFKVSVEFIRDLK